MHIPGYRPLRALYRGPTSLVWAAVRESDGLPVVVKRLASEYPAREALTEYKHQFELTANPPSPGVVRSLALHQLGHAVAIVMEDVGGTSLAETLTGGRVSVNEAVRIAIRIATTLGELHAAGIVHRNLSTASVLLNRQTGDVRLIDFRAASVLRREQVDVSAPIAPGSALPYLAPEQTGRTNAAVDYRSDYYALGAVLYELLTGAPPFPADHPLDVVYGHIARAPVPPHERTPAVPPFLSAIVLKLLAKAPEARYQSASGLLADLTICLDAGHASGDTSSCVPGAHDAPPALEIRGVYGRQREIVAIADALVRSAGSRGLITVAGFSGIGKTALVREVFAALPAGRYRVGAGKFDQLQRTVPYSAPIVAFQALLRQLLSERDETVAARRAELQAAVGPHGRLLTDVIPELAVLLGPQPPVEELPPTEAENRFDQAFLRFVRALSSTEPLLLFLDDLQWADAGSIRLLELMLRDQVTGLVVVAAYRDNEVAPSHPFHLAVERLRHDGVAVTAISLGPLDRADVARLVSDATGRSAGGLDALVSLLMRKTGGNPFFLIQFLRALHERGLLARGADNVWRWDLQRIEQEGITDNVVELLVRRMGLLPGATRDALSVAACIGHAFDLETLARVRGSSPLEAFAELMPALQEELVAPGSRLALSGSDVLTSSVVLERFRFLHDRIQQAAYALLPEAARRRLHLRIGRMLLHEGGADAGPGRMFAIAGHLNAAQDLLETEEERLQLARLDLEAARRAREAAAFGSALDLLRAGMQLIPADVWTRHYALALDLWRERVTLEYLNGDDGASRLFLDEAAARAKPPLDRADVLHMLIVQHTLAADYPAAIAVGRRALALIGLELPEDGYDDARDAEMTQVDRLLAGRNLATLVHLPPMTDPYKRLAMKLLASMGPPCYRSHPSLWAVIVATELRLCLESGDVPAAAYTYPAYGGLLGYVRGDLRSSAALAEAAFGVADKYGSRSDRSVAHLMVGASLNHWFRPMREAEEDYRAAYHLGVEAGNLQYAVYAFGHLICCRLFRGMNLDEQVRDIDGYLEFARNRRNQWGVDLISAVRLVLHTLTGRSGDPGRADGALSDEALVARCRANRNVQVLCIYEILKAHAAWLHGRVAEADDAARQAAERLPAVATQGLLPAAEFVFADALLAASLLRGGRAADAGALRGRLASRLTQLEAWAVQCPVNFRHKRLLIEAEAADLNGDPWTAQRLYDDSIAEADTAGFSHHEAVANELAGRFWLRHGQDERATGYLRRARYGFAMWGAHAKVAALEREFTGLLWDAEGPGRRWTDRRDGAAASSGAALDLQAVLRASQAIARTVRHDVLVQNLIRVAMENAGADRGVLIVPEPGDLVVVAAAPGGDGRVHLQPRPLSECQDLPSAIVRLVARTGETVLLDRYADRSAFAGDEYVRRAAGRSILCLPVHGQGTVSAVLYLENTLSDSAFTGERLQVLRILAGQAAISFANANYYARMATLVADRTRALEEANERLRREIEQRTRMEAHLIETQKVESIGRLAGGIAHDFNNHLTVINGLCDLMLESLTPHDPLRADVEEVRAAGERAATLTRQLLAYSRKQVIEPQPLNLNDVVGEVEKMLHRLIGEDVELRTDTEAEIGTILADRGQIAQVLMNLATNARDALGGCGSVWIRTANVVLDGDAAVTHPGLAPGAHVLLSVSDNGCGMPPEVAERIFDPFFTTKEQGKGTGLGLSTVYGIVRQMGGAISVDSHVGRGTTFTMYFPRVTVTGAVHAAAATAGMLAGGAETVLVVEDQPHVRRLTVEILRQHGYRVLQAADGAEALDVAGRHPEHIDLLITDVVMPGMTGRELAEALTRARPRLRVLFTSGYTDDIIAPQGVLDAGTAFLPKPFDPRALRERVRQVLDAPAV